MHIIILTVLALGFSTFVHAHEMEKGPNGGPLVDVAGRHVEMVAQGLELTVFLTGGDDKPLATSGVKQARALVQAGGKTVTVALASSEPNKLVGSLQQPIAAGTRVVVSATLADGQILQARFVKN